MQAGEWGEEGFSAGGMVPMGSWGALRGGERRGKRRQGGARGHKHQEPVVNRDERSEIEGRWSD